MSRSSTPTPCAVVVDSRNVNGMAKRAFGLGAPVSVEGVRQALRENGLAAQQIYIGTATRLLAQSPTPKARRAAEKNERCKERWQSEGAVSLEGTLADRDGEVQEKQVDVLLALRVAELAFDQTGDRTIVMLSEDMDLAPAQELAHRHGAQTIACSTDTVHRRPINRAWILLGSRATRELCPKGATTWDLRRHLIRRVVTAQEEAVTWKKVAPCGRDTTLMESNRGVLGQWRTSRRVEPRVPYKLHTVGVTIAGARELPMVVLSETARPGPIPSLVLGTVLAWTDPTQVKVTLPDQTTRTVTVPAGERIDTGQDVYLHQQRANGNLGLYYIGPGDSDASRLWEATSGDVATVTGWSGSGWLRADLPGTGEILVQAKYVRNAEEGGALRIAPAGFMAHTDLPIAMPITSCLPGLQ